MELLNNENPKKKQSEEYINLKNHIAFKPARGLIEKISKDYKDLDGNFVEQFQTTAFYPRLWELFLNELLLEQKFEILNQHNRPDFHLCIDSLEFFIEASSSNPSVNDLYTEDVIAKSFIEQDKDIERKLVEYYVIKLGSVLYSKLSEEYWELEWVKGKPLIFAVLPSHNSFARFLPDAKITEYLYGIEYKSKISDSDELSFTKTQLENHTHLNKTIPSNFFSFPETENISAVLFTNTCDLQKFNRMGQQGDFFEEDNIITRIGKCYDFNDDYAKDFKFVIGEDDHIETWAEGVSIFHNPNATNPLQKGIFKNVREVWLNSNDEYEITVPDFHPYFSMTSVAFPE